MSKKKNGRPAAVLTEDMRDKIINFTRDGMSVRSVCNLVGISEPTFYKFRNADEKFTALWHEAHNHAIKQLRYEAEECVANAIRKGSERSAQWFLSHKHPAEYAERRIQDNTQDLTAPFDRLLDAIAKRDETDTETEKK